MDGMTAQLVFELFVGSGLSICLVIQSKCPTHQKESICIDTKMDLGERPKKRSIMIVPILLSKLLDVVEFNNLKLESRRRSGFWAIFHMRIQRVKVDKC